jgi:methylmalonyl-CoA/ethylmalonyl-CoA epimerase
VNEIRPEWIAGLCSANEEERAKAAAEIYRAGRDRADKAVHAWWQNVEFAQLCGANPDVTVGLAVQPATFAKIREANGSPRLADVPSEQDVMEFELCFGRGGSHAIMLDVLTTREPGGEGAIARYLAKQGEGVQQVEFRCENVDRAAAILRHEFGIEPVYPAKRQGADGTWVNFFLVAASDGKKVLVELYQKSA